MLNIFYTGVVQGSDKVTNTYRHVDVLKDTKNPQQDDRWESIREIKECLYGIAILPTKVTKLYYKYQ